ncbi:MAG: polysaccharide deacetylase family protein [Chthoniobacter sp.]|nr:polysaccharide deacetylase family protein [Chthoniobacter sp.]
MTYPISNTSGTSLLRFGLLLSVAVTARVFGVTAVDPDPYNIMLQEVPEKTVVLSFDDSVVSHATVVAPLLKELKFGGSFYIADFDHFKTRKDWYMTWEQIKGLADAGFDVGNHTLGHGGASLEPWLNMEKEFSANKVPKPTTLAWPVYAVYPYLYRPLGENQYTFGRAGGNRPYRPTVDHPLNAPSWGIGDHTTLEQFISYAKRATGGRFVLFTFHGVPEGEHTAVSLAPEKFKQMMQYLKDNQYNVISLRDAGKYVDVKKAAKFLPFPSTYPWGGMKRDGNLLYISLGNIPADGKVTLPGVTTRIARAWVAGDEKKQPLKVTIVDTGVPTLEVPRPPGEPASGYPTVIIAALTGAPIATILDLVIPGAPAATISGDEIRVNVPLAADVTKLAPIYHTGSPEVTGQPASGASADFTQPQTYIITAADRATRRYRVTVTKSLGTACVTNPGFEIFDTAGEFDITRETNPTGATWTFKKANHNGEIGIRDLTAGGAPPAPDGSRHCVFMRGPGNGVAQPITFDKGNYTISFDAVKRSGYEKTAAPLQVAIDDQVVFRLESSQITEKWASYTTPVIPIAAGTHTLSFTLGEGEGMDMLDNIALHFAK